MSEEKSAHDLRSGGSGAGVVLIVRKGNRYGTAAAGERVIVDANELNNRSTMEACMTEEDYNKYLAVRAEAKKKSKKKNSIVSMVDEGLARLAKNAADKQRAKDEREAEAPPPSPIPTPTKNTASDGIPLYEEESDDDDADEAPPAVSIEQSKKK